MSTKGERQAAIESAVFRTITSEDWRRQLAAARRARNAVADKIREAMAARKQATGGSR